MSIVIAVLIAVSIGLAFSVIFVAGSPRYQCVEIHPSNKGIPYNICVLPKFHMGHHITADGRKFLKSVK
jgi:hypothetical protein